jgi:hypothetical protein
VLAVGVVLGVGGVGAVALGGGLLGTAAGVLGAARGVFFAGVVFFVGVAVDFVDFAGDFFVVFFLLCANAILENASDDAATRAMMRKVVMVSERM